MRRAVLIPAAVLLAGGLALLLSPYHMEMTGLVLLLLGLAAGLWGLFSGRAGKRGQLLLVLLVMLASAGVIGLMTMMNLIFTAGRTDWKAAERSEYALVLGANVLEDGQPSRILRSRIRAAKELMDRNPEVVLILSGSQGGDEPMTEARCMMETLKDMGADPARLIPEEESHNTWQNLQNCRELIRARGGTNAPVAIVTSEFHLRRALYIAGRLGMEACPVSAKTEQWWYRVNYTLREVFALVKEALLQTD